jgi:hypothetical protein
VLKNTRFNGVGIWIYESEDLSELPTRYKFNAIGFDGEYGFGFEEKTKRYYDSNALLINSTSSSVTKISIAATHFSRQGYRWLIESENTLPDIPFLVTDNLETRLVFNGLVTLPQEQDVIDLEYPISPYYFVVSDNWFGILTVGDSRQIFLLGFSSGSEIIIVNGDKIWSPEYDCSMGAIFIHENENKL